MVIASSALYPSSLSSSKVSLEIDSKVLCRKNSSALNSYPCAARISKFSQEQRHATVRMVNFAFPEMSQLVDVLLDLKNTALM